ncbi:MAG: hypothetical protein AVDCRST_MAG50-659, partial [uncultured Acidimicrobiales bacterium]
GRTGDVNDHAGRRHRGRRGLRPPPPARRHPHVGRGHGGGGVRVPPDGPRLRHRAPPVADLRRQRAGLALGQDRLRARRRAHQHPVHDHLPGDPRRDRRRHLHRLPRRPGRPVGRLAGPGQGEAAGAADLLLRSTPREADV